MTPQEALRICLERYAIPSNKWNEDPEWNSLFPEDVLILLHSDFPTMLCKSGKGWFVLGTRGNGPIIVWQQWKG